MSLVHFRSCYKSKVFYIIYILPDFGKRYRQMGLFASNSFVFFFGQISKVAILKTKIAAIAFFFSSPFFLLALSFSPFLFLR